jgi:hypothetical protein
VAETQGSSAPLQCSSASSQARKALPRPRLKPPIRRRGGLRRSRRWTWVPRPARPEIPPSGLGHVLAQKRDRMVGRGRSFSANVTRRPERPGPACSASTRCQSRRQCRTRTSTIGPSPCKLPLRNASGQSWRALSSLLLRRPRRHDAVAAASVGRPPRAAAGRTPIRQPKRPVVRGSGTVRPDCARGPGCPIPAAPGPAPVRDGVTALLDDRACRRRRSLCSTWAIPQVA